MDPDALRRALRDNDELRIRGITRTPLLGAMALADLHARRYDPEDPSALETRHPAKPPHQQWMHAGKAKMLAKKAAAALKAAGKEAGAGRRLTLDDFKRPGETDTFSMIDAAGGRLAAAWKASESDLDAWIAEERLTSHYAGKSLKQKREGMARDVLRKWQGSSGGPVATAAITGVADRLGAEYDLADLENDSQVYIRARPELRRPIESLGETMYAQTQAWFAERGITHVQVKRLTWRGPTKDDRRPFTSWSAEGSSGYVGEQTGSTERNETVPVKRVFSIPPTGFGTLAEMELVLLPPLPTS